MILRARQLLVALLVSGFVTAAGADGVPAAGQPHLLIVTGLGGESYYDELFARWSQTLREVARDELAIPERQIVHLAPGRGGASRVSTKSAVLAAIRDMHARSRPGDVLAIVLIGHGTAQGARVRFNLPGPDLSPEELAEALEDVGDRALVIVNTASASGPFLPALSAPGRIVITATSSGAENQHARFGGYFVAAFAESAADRDKDRRISVLEAFEYARREVMRSFERDARLQTEHAMLDDDGDRDGVRAPSASEGDGARAARVHLAAAPGSDGATDEAKRARLALGIEARRLVDRIEALKRIKPSLEADDFERRLEVLLIELALNRRALSQVERP